ncbi:MAG: hypothetical protein E6G41_05415 [Actinobacteria bacterium]|nr:MAG: hypothetical protein E6G41_05415 [Actinomycetota bacterium]
MDLVTARLALHALAEQVISPLRVQATGNEIALQPRPGGFGTPDLPGGGWAGVSGLEVVGPDGAHEQIGSLRAAARFVGLDGAQVWADGWADLEALSAEAEIHLWPEHFDVAIELGEATFGVSPGDENHPEPYAYVAPWSAPAPGEFWNATGFTGAQAPAADAAALFRAALQHL